MITVAGLLGGLGILCMIFRKTLLGLLIGMQFLFFGATMMFVFAGISSGLQVQGHIFGLFIILGGIAQLIVGYSLAIRLFFLRKGISLDEIRTLKQ